MANLNYKVREMVSMNAEVLKLALEIPFNNNKEAEIAYEVLRVDKEPPRSQVSKTLKFHENTLHVDFSAPTAHQLRTGANGFMDNLLLVCETMTCFGPPV